MSGPPAAPHESQRALLLRVARRAMIEAGLQPDFPPAALAEAAALSPAGVVGSAPKVRDLRALAWCSIDNDESRDLDQLTVAVPPAAGQTGTRVLVAVAGVSAVVRPGSALDVHAHANTTSVYTPPRNFPMLPDRLSTDLTSLVQAQDRLAMVIDFVVGEDGAQGDFEVYAALVRNQAKLAYGGVGAWLEGGGDLPAPAAAVPGLVENLRTQDRLAQQLRARRHEHGALELETLDVQALFEDDRVHALVAQRPNRARQLIEDFMIAANGAMARFLAQRRVPILRRVVRSPERWQRIVDVAKELGELLPAAPDARALNDFLVRRRAADPLRFPDLSLTVIKLMGRGEYMASFPGEEIQGHFGLAVSDYTHSTAPNRRYPDLIMQRLLEAALSGGEPPYSREQLEAIATDCTTREDAAQKVERKVRKAAAACLLSSQIGREFEGVVTGASPKGTWVRVLDPPAEGRVEQGGQGLDVGDRVRVKLIHTDPERGFIDFAATGRAGPGPGPSSGSGSGPGSGRTRSSRAG